MKLIDYNFSEGNYFVAMEYYRLIMNRTFLVLITDDFLLGLKVNGMVSVEMNYGDSSIRTKLNSLAISSGLENPFSYVKNDYLDVIAEEDIFGQKILDIDSSNFKIPKSDIVEVCHDQKKKWGMGYYPHDGKVNVKTSKKRYEFIILGDQSGSLIEGWIS